MVEFKLQNGQSGYDVVGKYIRRYWDHNGYEDLIVSIGTSYDGQTYCRYNEIASPYFENSDCVEFLNDWWEGEQYIRLFGIKSVSAFNISGGIYTEDENDT